MRAIAIDGPAGSGKSTVAKLVAEKLGAGYLDTGALYRAITCYLIDNKIDLDNEEEISKALSDIHLEIRDGRYYVNKEDLTDRIRSESVSSKVSKVSSYNAVRSFLLTTQQNQAKKSFHVLEGRDIATKVLPEADLKIFLTASPEVRAQRRMLDKKSSSKKTKEEILEALKKRDYYDSHRKISPLREAEDAIHLDTSNMTIDEVVETICKLWNDREARA